MVRQYCRVGNQALILKYLGFLPVTLMVGNLVGSQNDKHILGNIKRSLSS